MIIIGYGFGISGLTEKQVRFLKSQDRLIVEELGEDGFAIMMATSRKEFDENFDVLTPMNEVINGVREYIYRVQDEAKIIRLEPEYIIFRKNKEIQEEEVYETEEPGDIESGAGKPANTGPANTKKRTKS